MKEFADHTNRFDGKGEVYAKGRPRYADGLFAYMKDMLHITAGSVLADIGSGTGIFTQQLLDCGCKVFAVEPNRDMREKAEEKLSRNRNFISVDGSASHMGLSDHSVDLITAAQAFHWFEQEAFRRECHRVLKPDGKVVIVYNSRYESAACTKALADLQHRYNSGFRGFSNGMNDETCKAFFTTEPCQIYRADNTQSYDRQGYIDRVLSSSYSPKEDDAGYEGYLKKVCEIFDTFSKEDRIVVPADTVAYIGTV